MLFYSLNQWKTFTQSQNTISTDILVGGVLKSSQQEMVGEWRAVFSTDIEQAYRVLLELAEENTPLGETLTAVTIFKQI